MARLLLLFILVPIIELFLLIELGQLIGTLATLGLIAFTGMLGAYLARRQGLEVLRRIQADMAGGQLPAGSLVDGAIILIAGAVLITPGVLTDLVGFLCLIPTTRSFIKRALWRWLERTFREGRMRTTYIDIDHQPTPRDDINDS